MEEYIKVRYLVDMLEKRRAYQETHGFHRDAGYTSRFIDSIADIPRADVAERSQYELYLRLYHEVEEELTSVYDKLTQAETEIAKKIFDDLDELLAEIRSDARQKREANGELEHSLHFYTGKVVACGEIVRELSELKKKYKLED